jgi:hypothetical protein
VVGFSSGGGVIFPCDYQKPVFLDKGVILPVVVYFPLPSMPQLCRLWLSWLDLERMAGVIPSGRGNITLDCYSINPNNPVIPLVVPASEY